MFSIHERAHIKSNKIYEFKKPNRNLKPVEIISHGADYTVTVKEIKTGDIRIVSADSVRVFRDCMPLLDEAV